MTASIGSCNKSSATSQQQQQQRPRISERMQTLLVDAADIGLSSTNLHLQLSQSQRKRRRRNAASSSSALHQHHHHQSPYQRIGLNMMGWDAAKLLSSFVLVALLVVSQSPAVQSQEQQPQRQQQQPHPQQQQQPLPPALSLSTASPPAGLDAAASLGVAATLANNGPATVPQPSCENVRSMLELRGVSMAGAAAAASAEDGSNGMLRFCEIPAKGACCHNGMELKLASLSRQQLEKNTKESISKLASVLGTRATKFNEFFKQLLSESRREFHEMFKRTYGIIYEQNAYVFSDMFTELENYFTRGKVDLAEALDSFFNVLYQKMFSVINAQYRFDDKYLDCVSEHMKELKPFGDVPDKLSVQIKRSFVATRTFEQALSAAAEVARNLIGLRPSAECTAALTRMQQCGLCRGFAQKPCSNYCVNVMKGCLHYYNELDAEWDNFVASMEKVADRLLGPFNIVMVVEPMNIKVSEAIMNFQDTGDEITKQVFHGCGKPQLDHRHRRAVSPRFVPVAPVAAASALTASTVPSAGAFHSAGGFGDEDLVLEGGDSLESFQFADEEGEAEAAALSRAERSAGAGNRELQFESLKFTNIDSAEADDEAVVAAGPKRGGGGGRRKTPSSKRRQHGGQQQQRGGQQQRGQQQQQQLQQQAARNAAREEKREPMIDRLVKDIRQKVKDSKKFWSNLPFHICNQDDYSATVVGLEGICWNGNTADKYPHAIVQDIAANPEFPQRSAANRQSALVAQQLFALKNAVGNLRNAYNGLDVEWNDVEDAYDGSGSGSGGGGNDDDDDDPNGGSGLGAYPDYPGRIVPDHTDHTTTLTASTSGGSGTSTASGTSTTTHHHHGSTTSSEGTQHTPNTHHNHNHNAGGGAALPPSITDAYDEHENEVLNADEKRDRKKGASSSSTSLRFGGSGGMSLRQALITYLFPIYVAWFGGVVCDLF